MPVPHVSSLSLSKRFKSQPIPAVTAAPWPQSLSHLSKFWQKKQLKTKTISLRCPVPNENKTGAISGPIPSAAPAPKHVRAAGPCWAPNSTVLRQMEQKSERLLGELDRASRFPPSQVPKAAASWACGRTCTLMLGDRGLVWSTVNGSASMSL